ncbi:Hypothetical protein NGAL_HAMBI1145_11280 [Neorhizobium galegae bv. officinalis]|uniref:Uncharacterized protein n=1 Tax=Neorhizobium galegae bv. officinalis TaxID=323656 RepID=A0A0T7FBD4_NEOGA|nr:Hypothetical protein NGAL_HAMBI1145_11280 [Neorhizobium galegae bv. officinalis]
MSCSVEGKPRAGLSQHGEKPVAGLARMNREERDIGMPFRQGGQFAKP